MNCPQCQEYLPTWLLIIGRDWGWTCPQCGVRIYLDHDDFNRKVRWLILLAIAAPASLLAKPLMQMAEINRKLANLPPLVPVCTILAVSACYLGLMLRWSQGGDPAGSLLAMLATFIAFGVELYLFQVLFKTLDIHRLGLAWASGHLVFICLSTVAIYQFYSRDPIDVVPRLVPAVIDLPVTVIMLALPTTELLSRIGVYLERIQPSSGLFRPMIEVWLPGLTYAVLGSFQYYFLGWLAQNGSRPLTLIPSRLQDYLERRRVKEPPDENEWTGTD